MMNHTIQQVRAVLSGRQEKSRVAGRVQSEPLRRFVVVLLFTVSVAGANLAAPGHAHAAQGYFKTDTLYLWGNDLTDQTMIPVTVADGLQELGTGVDTVAYVLSHGGFVGGLAVSKVVIAKADISGYPIAADLSGNPPTVAGALTIGDGTIYTSVTIGDIGAVILQNDGTVKITDNSVLTNKGTILNNGTIDISRDILGSRADFLGSDGQFTNSGIINVYSGGMLLLPQHTVPGGIVKLFPYGVYRTDAELAIATNPFVVQYGHFWDQITLNTDVSMAGVLLESVMVNLRSLTLTANSLFRSTLDNRGSIALTNGAAMINGVTSNEGSFTANGSTIVANRNVGNAGIFSVNNVSNFTINADGTDVAVANTGSVTVDHGSTITINASTSESTAITNTNTGSITTNNGSTITINGVTDNAGSIAVDNGSALTINGVTKNTGSIAVANSSTITINGVTNNAGSISVANGTNIRFNDIVNTQSSINIPSGAKITIGKTIQSVVFAPAPGDDA